MKPIYIFALALMMVFFFSCEGSNGTEASNDAATVLEATRSKMLTTPTHHYRFTSFWDNRFASSTWADSMDITYSYLPESDLGFGFFAEGTGADALYDGKDYLLIDHTKRKVVRTTAAEINKDSSYFKYAMSFHGDPKALPEFSAVSKFVDTLVGGKELFLYTISNSTPVAGAPGKSTVSTREYYIDPGLHVVDRIRNSSHVGRDTSQIIDYFFTGYAFSDARHAFGASDREQSLAYREISEADDDEERLAGLVKPGAQLNRADYPDINGEEQMLYGKAGKKTVVMFSFVGCGACEYALREMKKKDFAVRDGVELMYSSPVDKSTALPRYLKKKAFPFVAFGKESLMNENFHAAAFPTFVLINEGGGVERVMGGYDQEVEEILFD